MKEKKYNEIVERLKKANQEGRIVTDKDAPFYDGETAHLTQYQIERMAMKIIHPKTLLEHIGFYRV